MTKCLSNCTKSKHKIHLCITRILFEWPEDNFFAHSTAGVFMFELNLSHEVRGGISRLHTVSDQKSFKLGNFGFGIFSLYWEQRNPVGFVSRI